MYIIYFVNKINYMGSMIKLYFGNTLSGCSAKIIDTLIENRLKGTHILIVPDRFTLSTESKLMNSLKSTFNIEVMTFERLAARVLEGKAKKCISPEGAAMLLAKTVEKHREKLLCYKRASRTEGFVKELEAAIFAIRSGGITDTALALAAAKLKGYAKEKLTDIITLYGGYLAELQENYTDSMSRLEALTKDIKESAFCASAEFYITDFYAFSGRQYDIIRELMLSAKCVHISVIADIGGDNRRIYPRNVRRRIEAMATDCGVRVESVPAFEELSCPKRAIEDNIFGYGSQKFCNDGYVTLYRAASTTQELKYICCRINEAVREQGLRYKNIGILCADLAKYAPVIERVFNRYGVPYFWDARSSLAAEPLAKQLLNYLRVCISNFSRGAMLEYAKNYFSDVSNVSYFENYCIKYSIDYTRFAAAFSLGEQEELSLAEPIRAKLLRGILPLPQSAKVAEYIGILREFISHNRFEPLLVELIERQRQTDTASAARSEQVWEKLENILSELDELMGEENKTLEQFYKLLESGFASVSIALIPQSVDCVYIGETEDSRFEDKRILFVAGASSGKIPFESSDSGILGERDYALWKVSGIEISPTLREKNLYARFYAEQLLVTPSDKLYVGYSELDAAGAKNNPSVIIGQLSYMFDTPIESAEQTAEKGFFTPQNAYKRLLDIIRGIRRGTFDSKTLSYADTLYHVLSAEQKKTLNALLEESFEGLNTGKGTFLTSGQTSVSELECYFGCPYKHFVRYGLRAKEREQDTVEARETGTVIHDMLEEYFRTLKDCRISKEEVAQRVNAIVDNLFEQPRFKSMAEGANAAQLMRLRRECVILAVELTELARQTEFVPTGFEVRFGKDGDYPGIRLMDGAVELAGKIDRIDEYGKDAAVIDYKTGKIDADLKYVYFGKKIQLYAYLAALKQADKRPAGAFYLPLRADYDKRGKSKDRYVYKGQLIGDERLLDAFDTQLRQTGESPIIPVAYSEKKGFTAGKRVLLTRVDMDNLIAYVTKLCEKALVEISEGYIAPNPVKEECAYCAAKNFCGFDKSVSKERSVSAVKLENFEEDYDI